MKIKICEATFLRTLANDYTEELENSLEQLIGLGVKQVEIKLQEKSTHESINTYKENLSSLALNTTFFDWKIILDSLSEQDYLIDLGSGYSKGSITNSILKLNKNITSIEFVSERVNETKRALNSLNLNSDQIIADNFLTNTEVEKGNVFFLYLPYDSLLEDLLERLQKLSESKTIKVMAIESHGDLIGKLKWCPWLKLIETKKLQAKRHDQNLYVFESVNSKQENHLYSELVKRRNEFSNNDQLLFKDEIGPWIADAKDHFLCHLNHDQVYIETSIPKRRIPLSNLQEICRIEDPKICELIKLRKERNWKKIYLLPEILVENSSGYRKTLAQILKEN